jgi:hypothetical protein
MILRDFPKHGNAPLNGEPLEAMLKAIHARADRAGFFALHEEKS